MRTCKIIKKIGVISKGKKVSKEINIVEWSEGYKVIDIRKWADEEAHKGISLNLAEAEILRSLLDEAINSMKSVMEGKIEQMDIYKIGFDPLSDKDISD